MIFAPHSRTTTFVAALAATALIAACDSGSTDLGPTEGPVVLSVVASDGSAPTGPAGVGVQVSGTLTLTGLDIELWDGETWRLVVEDEASAEISLADASAAIVLMSATELPGGDYTKARLTADEATIDLSATFDGKTYAREFRTRAGRQVVLEKDVAVTENPDGSRTLAIDLHSIRSVRLNGNDLGIGGDFGDDFSTGTTSVSSTLSLLVADASEPTDEGGEAVDVSGTVTLSGLTIELWDGESWLPVSEGLESAELALGDGSAWLVLAPTQEVPEGEYTKARLTATEAAISVSAMLDGRSYSTELAIPGDAPIVIEKGVTVEQGEDGSVALHLDLEAIDWVGLKNYGARSSLAVEGDLGETEAPADFTATLGLADESDPALDTGAGSIAATAEATLEGLTIELWDGEMWLLLVDASTTATVDLDGTTTVTLLPASPIPAATYEKCRLTIDQAGVTVTFDWNGSEKTASLDFGDGEPVEIEKPVEVTEGEEGQVILTLDMVMIRSLRMKDTQEDGDFTVEAEGDLGTAAATVSAN